MNRFQSNIVEKLKLVLGSDISGITVNSQEAVELKNYFNNDLCDLIEAASSLRNIGKGNIVTFSPKVFIPLTRLCRDYCGYCTFRVDPQDTDTLFLSPEEVLDVALKGQELGCTEALFTLGERPELRFSEAKAWLNERGYQTTLEYLTDMCEMVFSKTRLLPHANPGTMSQRELSQLRPFNPSAGMMLESTSELLYAEGGPHEFAPSKRPIARLKTIENAGKLRIPFTTGLLIGIGETLDDRIESLLAIRDLNRKYGHIQEVIVQNFRAKPLTPMETEPDADTKHMLWTVSVARLILGPDVNIQVPPNLSADNYQMYLQAGINDWGGVSPLTIDYVNPEAPWPTLGNLNIRTEDEGFVLKPRLPIYPEFFLDTDKFVDSNMRDKLSALVDNDGYVKGGVGSYVKRRDRS